jgi:hypothetical protein
MTTFVRLLYVLVGKQPSPLNANARDGTKQAKLFLSQLLKKNRLHHCQQDKKHLTPTEISQLQQQLKNVNKRNRNLVDLAKLYWYSGICTNIHNMRMNPRLAWENICLLTGGKTAHHKTNINMAMKLKNGDLASNTKENMSVFGMHFHKVLNNHRPVDNSVLNLIKQKPCLTTIDAPITFKEVKRAINMRNCNDLPSSEQKN